MSERNVLVVTVDTEANPYEEGRKAIRRLQRGDAGKRRATVRFQDESQLTDVFNERTYKLLRALRDEEPSSIRETARRVGRDKKNVHEELTTLEALGVIHFEEDGRAKRPVFPYDELVVTPLAAGSNDSAQATP